MRGDMRSVVAVAGLATTANCFAAGPLYASPAAPASTASPGVGVAPLAAAPSGQRTAVCAPSAIGAAAVVGLAATVAGASRQAHRLGWPTAGAKVCAVATSAIDKDVEEAGASPEDEDADDEELKERPPFDPSAQVGVTAPLGFFDPLGFCPPGDEGRYRVYRAAEIKHGRVAMLAAIGAVAQHYIRIYGLDQAPAGLSAATMVPSSYLFWFVLLPVIGCVELLVWTQSPDREPGNFGDPLNIGMYDQDTRNREINNGRMAMFSIMGIIVAELATGKDAVQQLGL